MFGFITLGLGCRLQADIPGDDEPNDKDFLGDVHVALQDVMNTLLGLSE